MSGRLTSVLRSLIFVLLALLLCSAIFQASGFSAAKVLTSIAEGAFLKPNAAAQSLRWALPLFITAVGVGISFRAGYFNIGAQGQFYVGSIAAAFCAEALNGAPPIVVVPALFRRRHGGWCTLGALARPIAHPVGHRRGDHDADGQFPCRSLVDLCHLGTAQGSVRVGATGLQPAA